MRKDLLLVPCVLGTVSTLLTTTTIAQQNDRFAYSITDVNKGSNWSYLRKLDLSTGQFSTVLLDGNDASVLAYDAVSKKQMTTPVKDARYGSIANAAFGTGVAAAAYDRKSNRIYYSPMFVDQLRYVDLKTMKVYFLNDQSFTGQAQKNSDQGNIVTRMAIASDGYGYALTNDGNELVRFSTGKKFEITKLGAVVDDPSNKGISIHNSCSSFGGDMIADDNGNLYIISARNHVFRLNIENKVATHLGAIKGLPANYTSNGAAVNTENKIILGTATANGGFFVLDHETLEATPYTIAGESWNSSDLANSNLLVSGTRAKGTAPDVLAREVPVNDKIGIYPNPVTNNQFAIRFSDIAPGTYTLRITDVTGREALRQVLSLGSENMSQNIRLAASTSKGVYLVKVTDNNNKEVYTTKLMVQ